VDNAGGDGIDAGDHLFILFDGPTDRMGLGSSTVSLLKLNQAFTFSTGSLTSATGSWVTTSKLRIEFSSASGNDNLHFAEAFDVQINSGELFHESDVHTDLASATSNVAIEGSFSFQSGPEVVSAQAADDGEEHLYSDFDSLYLTFSGDTDLAGQPSINSNFDASTVFKFFTKDGTLITQPTTMTGKWITYSSIELIFDSIGSSDLIVGDTVVAPGTTPINHRYGSGSAWSNNITIGGDFGFGPRIQGATLSPKDSFETYLTIYFDEIIDTSTVGTTMSKAAIEGIFSFSNYLGDDFTGEWLSVIAQKSESLRITFTLADSAIFIGETTVDIFNGNDIPSSVTTYPADSGAVTLTGSVGEGSLSASVVFFDADGFPQPLLSTGDYVQVTFSQDTQLGGYLVSTLYPVGDFIQFERPSSAKDPNFDSSTLPTDIYEFEWSDVRTLKITFTDIDKVWLDADTVFRFNSVCTVYGGSCLTPTSGDVVAAGSFGSVFESNAPVVTALVPEVTLFTDLSTQDLKLQLDLLDADSQMTVAGVDFGQHYSGNGPKLVISRVPDARYIRDVRFEYEVSFENVNYTTTNYYEFVSMNVSIDLPDELPSGLYSISIEKLGDRNGNINSYSAERIMTEATYKIAFPSLATEYTTASYPFFSVQNSNEDFDGPVIQNVTIASSDFNPSSILVNVTAGPYGDTGAVSSEATEFVEITFFNGTEVQLSFDSVSGSDPVEWGLSAYLDVDSKSSMYPAGAYVSSVEVYSEGNVAYSFTPWLGALLGGHENVSYVLFDRDAQDTHGPVVIDSLRFGPGFSVVGIDLYNYFNKFSPSEDIRGYRAEDFDIPVCSVLFDVNGVAAYNATIRDSYFNDYSSSGAFEHVAGTDKFGIFCTNVTVAAPSFNSQERYHIVNVGAQDTLGFSTVKSIGTSVYETVVDNYNVSVSNFAVSTNFVSIVTNPFVHITFQIDGDGSLNLGESSLGYLGFASRAGGINRVAITTDDIDEFGFVNVSMELDYLAVDRMWRLYEINLDFAGNGIVVEGYDRLLFFGGGFGMCILCGKRTNQHYTTCLHETFDFCY